MGAFVFFAVLSLGHAALNTVSLLQHPLTSIFSLRATRTNYNFSVTSVIVILALKSLS